MKVQKNRRSATMNETIQKLIKKYLIFHSNSAGKDKGRCCDDDDLCEKTDPMSRMSSHEQISRAEVNALSIKNATSSVKASDPHNGNQQTLKAPYTLYRDSFVHYKREVFTNTCYDNGYQNLDVIPNYAACISHPITTSHEKEIERTVDINSLHYHSDFRISSIASKRTYKQIAYRRRYFVGDKDFAAAAFEAFKHDHFNPHLRLQSD